MQYVGTGGELSCAGCCAGLDELLEGTLIPTWRCAGLAGQLRPREGAP